MASGTHDGSDVLTTWKTRNGVATTTTEYRGHHISSDDVDRPGSEAHPPRPQKPQEHFPDPIEIPDGGFLTAPRPAKVPHDNEGMQVLSTAGNGSVVMLTGSTGILHFPGVDDFYTKLTNNRLDYAKVHGTSLPSC
jgi:hypothetical protein